MSAKKMNGEETKSEKPKSSYDFQKEAPYERRRYVNNLKFHGSRGEVNEEPSMTEPDQNLSIPELLAQHTRGIPVINNRHREGIYSETEIPVIQDLNDYHEHRNMLEARAKDYEMETLKEANKKPKDAVSEQTGNEDQPKEKLSVEALKTPSGVPEVPSGTDGN